MCHEEDMEQNKKMQIETGSGNEQNEMSFRSHPES
jgi:hypothetical protein